MQLTRSPSIGEISKTFDNTVRRNTQGLRMSVQFSSTDANPASNALSKNSCFIMQRFYFIGTLTLVGSL